MSNLPYRMCNKCGCTRLTHQSYCDIHRQEKNKDGRPSAYKRGYNRAWQKASKSYLLHNPFCVRCLEAGTHSKSEVVDHIKPHKGNQQLFWDKSNWQPLCKRCHDKKTVLEDGGFGRRVGG